MKKKRDLSTETVELRRQAEIRLGEAGKRETAVPVTDVDTERLLHELQVHQIELEIQNEELLRSRVEVETLRRQYRDLYDFAPIGYFTLSRDGTIQKTNLASARLLGIERGALLKRRFGLWVAPAARPTFNAFLEKVFESREKKTCEVALLVGENTLWAHLEASSEPGQECHVAVMDITERVQAEAALRASEAKHRALIENSSDVIALVTGEGIILYESAAVRRVLGFQPAEMVGHSGFEFLHPDDYAASQELFGKLFQQPQESVSGEIRYKRKDDTWCWVQVTGANLLAEPSVQAIVINYHDITKRKQVEETLRESEERFRSLYENATIGMYRTTPNGLISMANPALLAMLGYPAFEELAQRDLSREGYEPEYPRQGFQRRIEQEGKIYGLESAWKRKDGSTIFVRESAHLVRDEHGQPYYYEGTVENITERVQAEAALRASEAKHRALIENSSDAIALLTGEGIILYESPAVRRVLGFQPDEMVGHNGFEFLHPDNYAASHELLKKLFQQPQEPVTSEVRYKRKDETWCWVQVTATNLLAEPSVQAIVINYHDITERKQAEETLRQSEELFRVILTNILDPVFITDNAGNFTFICPNVPAILGYSLEDIQALGNISKLIGSGFYNPEELKARGELTNLERTVIDNHGRQRTFLTNIKQVSIREGTCLYTLHDITERKQAEEALRLRESYLTAILENQPGLVWLKDVDGRFLAVNRAFADSCGKGSPAELVGKTDLDIWPNELAEKYRADDAGVIKNKTAVIVEEPIVDRSETKWFETFKTPIFDDKEAVIGTTGFSRDITERKQAEEALRESEERLALVLEGSQLGYWDWNIETGEVKRNVHWAEMLGYTLAEIEFSVKQWSDLHHPDDRERAWKSIQDHLEGRTPLHKIEYRMRTTDGQYKWILDCAKVVKRDAQGHPLRMSGTHTDITERKQAEEALRETSERLTHMLANSPTVIYALTVDGDRALPTWISGNIESILGFSAEAALQPNWWTEQIHPQDRPRVLAGLEHLFDDFYQHEYRFLRKDGQVIWLHDEHRLLRGDDNRPREIIGAWTDISERKQAEENLKEYSARLEAAVEARTRELQNAQEQLVRQEKLAVLGQLAGGVGHELRNPLAVILNAVYYLKLVQTDANDKIRQYHGMIEYEAHNAEKIITDLLDFARIKSVDREPVAVPELVQRVLERFPAPEAVTVKLDFPADLPKVFVDPRQIEQVLGNLVVNACQAMPGGGQLSVIGKQLSVVSEQSVKTDPLMTDNWILITIKDTGVGIPPENMKKLFEPLFTTKAKGIGLGLAVSQKLVEANGGKIEGESESGKGSTFTVYLPVHNVTARVE